MDKAAIYLENNHQHMRYDKALAAGWPIATGMIEGACRFESSKTDLASPAPDGPPTPPILKLRTVVVNGDLDDYMNHYKKRYLQEHHLARYDPTSIPDLRLTA